MKKRNKPGIYHYLAQSGILETGTPEDIAHVRIAYWKAYRNRWKREQKKAKKVYSVSFSFAESKLVRDYAAQHNRSIAKYIQETCLAYSSRSLLMPDPQGIRDLKEQLLCIYYEIQALSELKSISVQVTHGLLDKLSQVEKCIIDQVQYPKVAPDLLHHRMHAHISYHDAILVPKTESV